MEHDVTDFQALQAIQVSPVDFIVRVSDVFVDHIVLRFLHDVEVESDDVEDTCRRRELSFDFLGALFGLSCSNDAQHGST